MTVFLGLSSRSLELEMLKVVTYHKILGYNDNSVDKSHASKKLIQA